MVKNQVQRTKSSYFRCLHPWCRVLETEFLFKTSSKTGIGYYYMNLFHMIFASNQSLVLWDNILHNQYHLIGVLITVSVNYLSHIHVLLSVVSPSPRAEVVSTANLYERTINLQPLGKILHSAPYTMHIIFITTTVLQCISAA